ncbi:MAG TPA: tetratricopeptide repeat protein [Nitrospiria bacterium]|nr:tetratricopeptide repeat protein [Nitrospiria bacterium]
MSRRPRWVKWMVGGAAGLALLAGMGVLTLWSRDDASLKAAAEAAYQEGVDLNKQHRLDQAVEQLTRAVTWDPDTHRYHQALVMTFIALRQGPQAIHFYKELVLRYPKSGVVHYWLGRLYLERQSLDDAAREFELARQLAPQDEHPLVSLGHVYLRQGKEDEALAAYRKANELSPRIAAVHAGLGTIYFHRKEDDKAEAEYNDALMIDPSLSEARYNLSIIYERRKQWDQAVKQWKKLLDDDPNESQAREHLARYYLNNGQYADAVNEYTTLSEVRESSPEVFLSLGEAQILLAATLTGVNEQRELKAAATESFQHVLDLEPSNAQARRYLEQLNAKSPPKSSPESSPEFSHDRPAARASAAEPNH